MENLKFNLKCAIDDFFLASKAVREAENRFNCASPEYFDIANIELSIAKMQQRATFKRVQALQKEIKRIRQ